jgi:hypothetical protein
VGFHDKAPSKQFMKQAVVTIRGKRPPADIITEAEKHMATVNGGTFV